MNTQEGSHRHGTGRLARWAYGSRQNCKPCSEYDKNLAAARERMQRDVSEVTFQDGSKGEIDRGIIVEISPAEVVENLNRDFVSNCHERVILRCKAEIEDLKSQIPTPYATGDILTLDETWGYSNEKRQYKVRVDKCVITDDGQLHCVKGIRLRKDGTPSKPVSLFDYSLGKLVSHEKAEAK